MHDKATSHGKLYDTTRRMWTAFFTVDLGPDGAGKTELPLASWNGSSPGIRTVCYSAWADWRRQTVQWLEEELAALEEDLEQGSRSAQEVRNQFHHFWSKEPDLAGIRDRDRLAALPEEERATCEELWAAVNGLLKRLEKERGQ